MSNWYVGTNSTNNGYFGWLFEAAGGSPISVNATGVSATGSIGNVDFVTNANFSVSGVSATAFVQTFIVIAKAQAFAAGVVGTTALGND
jgi:hypothetical protein